MDKHLLLPLVIFLAILQPLFSQDSAEVSDTDESFAILTPSANGGIYKQPRWVSWPATTLSFNALGFAEAGPVIQMEINVHKGFYIVPSFRYNYLGYASHQLMTGFATDSTYSPGSFAAGLGVREFLGLQKKNRLVFFGIFGEYSIDKATYNGEDAEGRFESERTRQAVNVVANVGYRWWFRKNFFLHMGIYGGLSFELKDESIYLNGALAGDLENDFKNTPFVGLIDLSIGWNL
jgi:hypothetical protein